MNRFRTRGQIVVIFAGAMVALMVLLAMVVDIGWYWSSNLKMQRAADAAALAGAVYLPDNFNGTAPNAQTAALASAKRNGYVPDADTTVTSVVDPYNPRQLDVTITNKVSTFFLRVVGIQSLNASRASKAEFVLPVPMGSPQNYYGVGTFVGLVTTTNTTSYVNPSGFLDSNPTLGASPAGSVGSQWTKPQNAYASDGKYATDGANGDKNVWTTFTFGSFMAGAKFDGVVINAQAQVSGTGTCQLKSEVSWNGGGTWSNAPNTSPNMTKSLAWYALGSATDPSDWDSTHTTWSATDFSAANFEVRLTYVRAGTCGTVSLDEVNAVVYSHVTTTNPPVETAQAVAGPTGASLTTQGFWGADITLGGSRENGDQFDPANDNMKGVSNSQFDGKGVDYTVIIAGANGQLQLFDPTFCETGQNSAGGNYGAGDHWIGGGANPVTTTYVLYNENGTPYDASDDSQVATSGSLFANKTQADYGASMGADQAYGSGSAMHGGLTDCSADPYHNHWYQLASGLPAGTYRLNVSTNTAGNASTNAENMWSAWVSSATGASQVYGQGTMVTYNNLVSGKQLFYLAQIDQVHAGKTMEVKLFDPGDVSGNAYLRIESPDGNAYNYVNFTWTADNGKTGSGSTIQTASSGSGSLFQDALITIEIPLPATYGSGGLTPSGEPGAGWWKIEYTVDGGNDTTTWQVDIQGNPVHLLVP